MKILDVLPSVNPELGGPAEVVRQRGLYLAGLGHGVEVLTLDDPRAGFVQNYPLPVHALGPSMPGYGYNKQLVPWLRSHAQDFDAVVVEGLWQYPGLGTWRALRRSQVPYYVFSHGMLDPWFKRRYPLKHLKKWLYWPWAEYRVLRDAAAVLFTAEAERLLARQSFWLYSRKGAVVGFRHDPATGATRRHSGESFTIAFRDAWEKIGAVPGAHSQKKGCDCSWRRLRECWHSTPTGIWSWPVPIRSAGKKVCTIAHRSSGMTSQITWTGMISGAAKWGALRASEDFRPAVAPGKFWCCRRGSIGRRVPALISNKVNIWREIEADGAGLVAPDTVDGTESLLRRWLELGAGERARFREQARRTFENRFAMEATANDLLEVIRSTGAAGNQEKAVLSRR